MRLFGLIGYPLSHSFSEKYFTAKFEREKISDCRYQAFPIASIDQLPGLLETQQELSGLNVTIPYKREVLPFINKIHLPKGLNACNCIRIKDGVLHGYNTDWTAFRESIYPVLHGGIRAALVLGNGGAAEAVCFALKSMDIAVHIVSRTPGNGAAYTYGQLDEQVMNEHKLIVNTTPLGLYPRTAACPGIPYQFLSRDHLLFDLVYNPAKTVFLQKGEERGATIMNGEEMLVLQAEESWRIWNDT
jgi:shikimate dehydrogenase